MIDSLTYRMISQLLQAEANQDYIARFCGVSVKDVENVATRVFDQSQPSPRKPITMPPFPDLSLLDDQQRILILTKRGMAVPKIMRHLTSPNWTQRQINRFVVKHLGPARRPVANSRNHHLSAREVEWFTRILVEQYGKDQHQCEICLDPVPNGATLHHTKYEGATIFDLLFVCQSCNLARENVGLD